MNPEKERQETKETKKNGGLPGIMASEIASQKAELRTRLRAVLQGLSPARRAEVSARACALLVRQKVWREARAVLFYAPLPDEIDLLPLLDLALASGKTAALPGFVPDTGVYGAFRIRDFAGDCAPGKFGVAEPSAACAPVALNVLDLALAPGLGFDAAGRRLGRGQGFYDRLLAQVAGTRCGVAFDEQLVGQIPAQPHDINLNCLLTPTQWLEFPETPRALP
jgi:5-formyltetrahydrofolate cyclo-ligase